MGKDKVLLGSIGEYFRSKYYFDEENNCFLEEKYHEEYLDTGTVFDGVTIISPQQIYANFIEELNFNGIKALLECFSNRHPLYATNRGLTEEEFYQEINVIDRALKKNLQIINDTYIIRNQYKAILGVLFGNAPFYAYKGLYMPCKGFISQGEAFSYAVECLRECYTPRTILVNNKPSTQCIASANDPSEKGLIKYEKIESLE